MVDLRKPWSVRISESERYMFEEAAAKREEPVSTYVRRRALEAAQRDLGRRLDEEDAGR